MKRVPKIVWSLLACVICIVVTAAACLILADSGASSDKYMEVIRVIETTFYQPKDTSSLEDASASAMVASLATRQATICLLPSMRSINSR